MVYCFYIKNSDKTLNKKSNHISFSIFSEHDLGVVALMVYPIKIIATILIGLLGVFKPILWPVSLIGSVINSFYSNQKN